MTPPLSSALTDALPGAASRVPAPPGAGTARPIARRGVLLGFAASVAVHIAFSFWPAESPASPDASPLLATITELPPPPKPVAVPAPTKPRPKRANPVPTPVAMPEPASVAANDVAAIEPTAEAIAAGPELPVAPAEVAAAPPEPLASEAPAKTLPPRVDLVYKAFFGTRGFFIGDAVYRFEHAANEYRISTVGEARGLAALFLRGQGKVESRGFITASGLQPHEFAVERGSRERREMALFDWETGIVTLHEQKTAVLDLPTFDPLALMWQAYFSPPTEDRQAFSLATTRRVARYTITREGEEKITWPSGEVDTERWHRRSEDGKTDAYIWLAPTLRYLPVKMRLSNTDRGTVEALLDSIRVDEELAQQ